MKNYLGKQLYKSAFYPLLFLALLWLIYFLELNYEWRLSFLGVLPREIRGLPGVITSVFVHGDINHLASNSFPILFLGMMLFFFYRKIAIVSFVWIWVISGIWLWVGGRNNVHHPTYHIGASTLIYGLATFLFFSGVFRRHVQLMVVSALVVFLYGSIMWGIFPIKTEISWEGHLFGAIAGVLVAFNYRKEGPQRKIYHWEEDDNDDGSEGWYSDNASEQISDVHSNDESEPGHPSQVQPNDKPINIRYIYKKQENKNE